MTAREWEPGDPIPEKYSGMPVTFEWNDVALTSLLRALENEYRPGYVSMCDHVRAAMRSYVPPTPPKPDEPTGLGAVVTTESDGDWIRVSVELANPWLNVQTGRQCHWDGVSAVRVLSEGVTTC